MSKIDVDFITKQYSSGIKSYTDFTKEVGLWLSESYVFEKHLNTNDEILDLGCGTGRTTFALHQKGYTKITAVDLTEAMINGANALNDHFKLNITFKQDDATQLSFRPGQFDAVIFSFNGLMSIPSSAKRQKAVQEIYRVLKANGIFIFTSHDRNQEVEFLAYWEEEKKRWEEGKQDPRLHEFGDRIAQSKNEESDIYIHIPSQEEVKSLLSECSFDLVETFYRSDRFDESEQVKAKSGECRFWVARKSFKTI